MRLQGPRGPWDSRLGSPVCTYSAATQFMLPGLLWTGRNPTHPAASCQPYSRGVGACVGQFSCMGSPHVLVCRHSQGGQHSVGVWHKVCAEMLLYHNLAYL